MSRLDRKRIRLDWEELEEAFADTSSDHRYYLDRETGAVHFFSAYLDNDAEEEDERALTSENRYVLIPLSLRLVPVSELTEFVRALGPTKDRSVLESYLSSPEAQLRFEEAIAEMPEAKGEWLRFVRERLDARIKSWLDDVGIEPLE
jgi:hypothetical protein